MYVEIDRYQEQIIVIHRKYIGKSLEMLHMFGKSSFLDLESSTMIHADSVSYLTSTDDRIQKYSSTFGFPWTNPSVNSYIYNIYITRRFDDTMSSLSNAKKISMNW